jgi:hypothetical protein
MTHQDQNAARLNRLWKQGEEMFHGSTIRELTGLVDEVMRTHETNVVYKRSGNPNSVLGPPRTTAIPEARRRAR